MARSASPAARAAVASAISRAAPRGRRAASGRHQADRRAPVRTWKLASPAGRSGSSRRRRYVSVTRRFRAPAMTSRLGPEGVDGAIVRHGAVDDEHAEQLADPLPAGVAAGLHLAAVSHLQRTQHVDRHDGGGLAGDQGQQRRRPGGDARVGCGRLGAQRGVGPAADGVEQGLAQPPPVGGPLLVEPAGSSTDQGSGRTVRTWSGSRARGGAAGRARRSTSSRATRRAARGLGPSSAASHVARRAGSST